MPTILRVQESVNIEERRPEELETRVAVSQALIPLGLQAVAEALQHDVLALAGPRYARGHRPPGVHRWTTQRGSVYLADQKLPITRPRLRNRHTHQEVPLPTYHQLQQPRAADEGVLRRILHGLSCRDYRACAEAVPAAFGLSASTMSRRYIRASARKLQELLERRLDGYDFVASCSTARRLPTIHWSPLWGSPCRARKCCWASWRPGRRTKRRARSFSSTS